MFDLIRYTRHVGTILEFGVARIIEHNLLMWTFVTLKKEWRLFPPIESVRRRNMNMLGKFKSSCSATKQVKLYSNLYVYII